MNRLARHLVTPSGEDLRVAQGVIRSWNAVTFGNRVEVDGELFEDLPVASGVEALTYTAGDVVIVEQWFPGGKQGELGLGTAWIRGRIITPGTGAAENAIAFMQTTLATQIVDELVQALLVSPAGQTLAAFAFASRVRADEVASSVGINSASYVTGTGGPVVTNVPVSSSGLALVGIQAQISIIASPTQTNQAYISYRVTGATSRSATDANAKRTDIADTDPVNITAVTDQSMSWSIQSGLNEGLHTFEAMYRSNYPSAYINRRIIVIAL